MKSENYSFASWLFLRVLALVHVVAFVSFWSQTAGLIGPHGILPAARLFDYLHQHLGRSAWLQLPSLCWWLGTGAAIPALCAAGIALAVLLFAGVAPALCLALLWADYLSLACAGQIFFDFQWDALLLETTLLAIFLAPWSLLPGWRSVEPPGLARGLLLWLLFRLMLLSGLVKLYSGDPNWWHLTALTFHYQTQPLPTPLAWHAEQLPLWFQKASCALMFLIELGLPWLIPASKRWRRSAALAMIALQLLIAATGNYTFFNVLTIALCLLCLDDEFWGRLPTLLDSSSFARWASADRRPPNSLLKFLAGAVIFITGTEAIMDFSSTVAEMPALDRLVEAVAPFRSLNNYGLFARMTTRRPELIIQGSDDGRDWRPYEFPHKPGDPARRPDFVAPFQPRLDWQLWFAALSPPDDNRWVLTLCQHLLHGTPEVLSLFARNPFPGHPPRFVRVVRYDYRFTSRTERAQSGDWWQREVTDFYIPEISSDR